MRTDSVIISLKHEDYRSLVIGIGALGITERTQLQRKIVEAGIVGERLRHCCGAEAQQTMFIIGERNLNAMNIPPRSLG